MISYHIIVIPYHILMSYTTSYQVSHCYCALLSYSYILRAYISYYHAIYLLFSYYIFYCHTITYILISYPYNHCRLTSEQVKRIQGVCCGGLACKGSETLSLRIIPGYGTLWPLNKCMVMPRYENNYLLVHSTLNSTFFLF